MNRDFGTVRQITQRAKNAIYRASREWSSDQPLDPIMTSVSTLLRMIGAASPSSCWDFGMSALHRPHVGNGAPQSRGCSRRWLADGSWRAVLTADKIAIEVRDRALPRRHVSPLAAKAHRSTRLTPFEAASMKPLSRPSATASRLTGL